MTFEEFAVWLYKVGTGWLGWSPHDTRHAHMQEITLAFEGHVDKLKAIHGTNDNKTSSQTAQEKPRVAATFDNFNKLFGT